MSNKMRWKYGDTNPVIALVDSAVAIEIGDLLYYDTDDAKPATSQADQGSEILNQKAFALNFLGVAMGAKAAGAAGSVRVATAGVFEMDCPSATHELGALLGASENGTNDALLDQQVEVVTVRDAAIGRVARRDASAATVVLINISSAALSPAYMALAAVGSLSYGAGAILVGDGNSFEEVALTGPFELSSAGLLAQDCNTVAAAGSLQNDATAITTQGFILATAADATKGVALPAAAAGKMVTVKNNANAVLKVWPASGDAINALSANAAISIAAYTCCTFHSYDGTTWYTQPLLPS